MVPPPALPLCQPDALLLLLKFDTKNLELGLLLEETTTTSTLFGICSRSLGLPTTKRQFASGQKKRLPTANITWCLRPKTDCLWKQVLKWVASGFWRLCFLKMFPFIANKYWSGWPAAFLVFVQCRIFLYGRRVGCIFVAKTMKSFAFRLVSKILSFS